MTGGGVAITGGVWEEDPLEGGEKVTLRWYYLSCDVLTPSFQATGHRPHVATLWKTEQAGALSLGVRLGIWKKL